MPRNQKLVPFGLKHNPFSADIPIEVCRRTPALETLCWRTEQLVHAGGYAAVNLRMLMNHGDELLDAAVRAEARQIDEKLYFDTFELPCATRARSVPAPCPAPPLPDSEA